MATVISTDTQLKALQFERVAEDDLLLLRSVASETFHEAFIAQNDPAVMAEYLETAFSESKVRSELLDPDNHFFFVRYEGEIAGYCKLTEALDPQDDSVPPCISLESPMMLERFYLRADYHGKGIAQAMMAFCYGHAVRLGCDVLWLGVWEHNHKALRFYEKCGFKKVGEHLFIMGDEAQTDYWMMRSLLA